jgi:hypothetical protein
MAFHDPFRCNACFDTIAGIPIHIPIPKNRSSQRNSVDETSETSTLPAACQETHQASEIPLWKADILVYLAGRGFVHSQETCLLPNFTSEAQLLAYHADRKRKAMIWFMVGEKMRQENLLDLCGRESSAGDVWRRLCERVGGGREIPLMEE